MRGLADGRASGSFSNSRRSRRFEAFARLVDGLLERQSRPVRILDVGGTNMFWEQRGWAGRPNVEVVLVNLEAERSVHDNIEPRVGDATNLHEFADRSFDVVFSNSVIEHLETYERQAAMAAEVRRVAPVYWVQTPNFWFPIEPHFLVPAWHWTPERLRVEILTRRGVGWAGRCDDRAHAERVVQEHRLMRRGELARLFPDATLVPEHFSGLVKSWTAVRGL
jgi:hypothetical protein